MGDITYYRDKQFVDNR